MHLIPWVLLYKSNSQIIFQIKEGGMFKSHIINHTSKISNHPSEICLGVTQVIYPKS